MHPLYCIAPSQRRLSAGIPEGGWRHLLFTALHLTVSNCTVATCIALNCTGLSHIVLSRGVLHHNVLFILHCTVLQEAERWEGGWRQLLWRWLPPTAPTVQQLLAGPSSSAAAAAGAGSSRGGGLLAAAKAGDGAGVWWSPVLGRVASSVPPQPWGGFLAEEMVSAGGGGERGVWRGGGGEVRGGESGADGKLSATRLREAGCYLLPRLASL